MSDRESRIEAMLARRAAFRGIKRKTAADYFVVDARTETADLFTIFDGDTAEASELRWRIMTDDAERFYSMPSGVKGCAIAA